MIYGHHGKVEDRGVVFTVNVADCCSLRDGEIEEVAWKCIETRWKNRNKSMENVHIFISPDEAFSIDMSDGWGGPNDDLS